MSSRRDESQPAEPAAEALAAIVRSSPDAIMTVALTGEILTWNRGAEKLYGYTAAEAIGRMFRDFFPNDDNSDIAWAAARVRAGEAVENIEVARQWPDGEEHDLAVTMSPIFDANGEVAAAAVIAGDITHIKEVERRLAVSVAELREAALRDIRTGVGSRELLLQSLSHLPEGARDITVLLIDVDEFQYFNQNFGHGTGDAILVAFGKVLREIIDDDDILARTAGDEFAIMSHSKGADRGVRLAQAIGQRLIDPVQVESAHHAVTVGIGVATASRPLPELADFLLRRADMAQFEAKKRGHGLWCLYDAEMEAAYATRTQMEERLRRAVAAGDQLWLAYQPICDTHTGVVTEVEALLRWDDPDHGRISPADFIPVAENCGLIVPLGEWVLDRACREIAALGPVGADLRLNVNVSPRQLADPGFATAVAGALQRSGILADQLILEITESAIVGSGETLVAELLQLRELGVGLAVDDFGTGHSSLSRLHSLPFTTLKIDKTLVDGIGAGRAGDIIVNAVVGMAHGLALSVVAEGVEQRSQLGRLRELDCDLIQGYLLHMPLRPEELRSVLSVNVPR